jgi:hypothetical protein
MFNRKNKTKNKFIKKILKIVLWVVGVVVVGGILFYIYFYLLITCRLNNIKESFRKTFDPCYELGRSSESYNPKLEYFIAEDRVCVKYYIGCWTSVRSELKTLRGADPKTFEILSDDYGKDKKNVYYDDKKISGANPKTFKVLNSQYGKDLNNAYYLDKKIKGADPDTFTVTDDLPWPTVQDKNYTYYGCERR